MIKKFYDMAYDGGGGVYVVKHESHSKKTIIECECGTHMLQVQTDLEVYTNSDLSIQSHREFYLAMFSYGDQKRGFWDRLKIAFKYLKSGKMFSDQLCLSPDEAKKLADFITSNADNSKTG